LIKYKKDSERDYPQIKRDIFRIKTSSEFRKIQNTDLSADFADFRRLFKIQKNIILRKKSKNSDLSSECE
jgi:hypothetical protein